MTTTAISATTLSTYLESVGCYDVQPVIVRIGRDAWHGARFKQDILHSTREGIYVLGYAPKSYWRSSRVKFTLEGDTRTWFIASYFPAGQRHGDNDSNEFHPFGAMFQLQPWSHDEAIDRFEERPYRSQVLTVIAVGDGELRNGTLVQPCAVCGHETNHDGYGRSWHRR